MSKRSLLKFCFALFGGLAFLAAFAFVVQNMRDDELKPEVTQILARKRIPASEEIDAYKYLLGFRAPVNVEPAKVGEVAYAYLKQSTSPFAEFVLPPEMKSVERVRLKSECRKGEFCSKETLERNRERVNDDLNDSKLIRERLAYAILHFPSFGSDTAPALRPWIDINEIFTAHKATAIEWSQRLQTGQENAVAKQLVLENVFFIRSLAYSDSLLSTMIFLSILKENRAFAKEGARTNSTFAKALTPEMQKSFILEAGFERLAENAIASEVIIFNRIIDQPLDLCDLAQANIQDSPDDSCHAFVPKAIGRLIVDLSLKRQATLNLVYAAYEKALKARCVRTVDACESESETESKRAWYDWRNPVGRGFLQIFSGGSPSLFKKMYGEARDLALPLALPVSRNDPSAPIERASKAKGA